MTLAINLLAPADWKATTSPTAKSVVKAVLLPVTSGSPFVELIVPEAAVKSLLLSPNLAKKVKLNFAPVSGSVAVVSVTTCTACKQSL